ncbi:retrovirus-related pol polyprotein from transposon TNT 1-94 [Tanacetum coccineum]
MSTQQDIYAAGSENRPPMLNKDNYVPWSSRIIRYARSRPNGKMIVDSIENGPYVRRMIATPGEPDLPVPVPETFHEQTDEELTENDIKRMDADDQAIQTILLGLPEDVYAAVDSCETAKEIWERVRQMMKGSDIGEQEKKAKLFNEWEKFTSTDGESIESYYHRFMQLMNDLKRNKHFPENIAANLKFLNNLQPEWKRHVTIVRQTKNLHEADFTQIYDFLKMNQDEVNELRAERITKTHDPLALMAHSQNPYNFPATHNDQSSSSTHSQQSFPINKYNPQPSFNQNFTQPPMTSLEDINDPTEAMNAALILFAKAFQLTTPTNNNQRTSSNPRNRQIAQPGMNMGQDRQIQNIGGNGGNQFGQYAGQVAQNQQGYNAWQNVGNQVAQNAVQNLGAQNGGNQNGLVVVPGIANQNGTGNIVAARAEGTGNGNQVRCYNCRGLGHIARNCTARPRRRDAAYLQTQLLIAQKEEAGIQLQAEEFDFMAAAGDLDEIEEVNANCILMANLQQASTSGTQLDKAPVYDTDGSAEVVQICLWCIDSGCSKHMTGNIKLLINFVWKFLGTVRFGNDHIAAILGYGDLKWGNITIARVYFVEGLGHNLFSVGQFCDADLVVAFRRNTCFIRDLDGVDLLKGNRTTNLFTINLYDMASASPICLMARAIPTKSWLWHQ